VTLNKARWRMLGAFAEVMHLEGATILLMENYGIVEVADTLAGPVMQFTDGLDRATALQALQALRLVEVLRPHERLVDSGLGLL
jgi:hypothetical protein